MSHVKNIDANQLKSWLNTGEALLVDVREPHEFTEWRIPQAISMPLTNIDKHLTKLDLEHRKIVFQCLKGKRGEMAAEVALESFKEQHDIYNLTGGIEAWDAIGLNIIRDTEKKGIPIMRQVLITAGGLILFFSLLTLIGWKFGAILSLSMGGGLLFAGLTGNCAMANLLQKMPWSKGNRT